MLYLDFKIEKDIKDSIYYYVMISCCVLVFFVTSTSRMAFETIELSAFHEVERNKENKYEWYLSSKLVKLFVGDPNSNDKYAHYLAGIYKIKRIMFDGSNLTLSELQVLNKNDQQSPDKEDQDCTELQVIKPPDV